MRLIDILNKIANGELKEGTKVKVFNYDFAKSYNYHLVFNEGELRTGNGDIFVCPCKDLNEECELIEPNHLPGDGKMIEQLDAVQCEPMLYNSHAIMGMIIENRNKLNEVIRYINKENNNE